MSLSRRLRRQAERQANKGLVDINKLQEDSRYRYTAIQFEHIINKLDDKQRDLLMSNPLPKDYKQIRQIPMIYKEYLENISVNLQWYEKTLKTYKAYIEKFLLLKKEYEKCMLLGKYNEALTILKNINQTICYSQWSIEQSLLVNEYKNGLIGNKQTLQIIIEGINGVVGLAAQLQSMRIEKNLPLFQFNDILSKVYEDLAEPERNYYSYKAEFFRQKDFNWTLLLWAESSSSIIDRYLMFQEATSVLACSKNIDNSIKLEITKAIVSINKTISDPLLYNTALSLNSSALQEFTIDLSTIRCYTGYDLYLQGFFSQAVDYCLQTIEEYPELIDLYEVYICSLLNLKKSLFNPFSDGSISNKALSILYELFSKGDEVEQALTDLLKLCYSLGSSNPLSFKLFAIFSKHYSYIEHNIHRNKLAIIRSTKGNSDIGLLNENVYKGLTLIEKNPSLLNFITAQFDAMFLRKLHNLPTTRTIIVHPFQQAIFDADILNYQGFQDQAVEKYDFILGNQKFVDQLAINFNLEDILHRKLICYIKLQDFSSAIYLVATSNLKNPGFSSRLGYEVLVERALLADDDLINSSITTPIMLSQYSLRYSVSTNNLWTAYDNFMFNTGIRIPSELREHIEVIDHNCLVYFLKNICVQEILGLSYEDFENEDELDNERMAVLAILCEIDIKNYEEYVGEIQTLSSSIEIRKGIKQLDESKIYVDVPGIRTALEKDLKESFNRSIELDSLNMPGLDKLLERLGMSVSVFQVGDDSNRVKIVTKSSQEIASNSESRYQSFVTAFLKIRDMFVTNSDFGLDSYISMRIRHGALLGQIRSIFDGFRLVTRRKDDTNEYMDNIYWTERLDILDISIFTEMNTAFARFSSCVDQHSEELKNRWIQLNTEQKPTDGLFNYVYSDRELDQLYDDKFSSIRSYDEFFDLVIEELWMRTEKNLKLLREHVLAETQIRIIDALEVLNKDLTIVLKDQDSTELIRSITECKTQFRYEIEKIANWFKRSSSITINDFLIELPIKASLTTVRKMHHRYNGFQPNQQINSSSVFIGQYFAQFSDLFRNLFDNILTHAGLLEEELQVLLSVTEQNGFINIVLTNMVSPDKNIEQLNDKINKIKTMLTNPLSVDITRSEGGTGYPKINKLLRSDLGRKSYTVQIDTVTEERIFKVVVHFELRGLTTKQ